jgi:hypothetical protein
MAEQKNEGEGNKTAARRYNEETQRFVVAGKVDKAAQEAAAAMEGSERAELERARKDAAGHAKEHDPEEQRDYRK